ELAARSNIPRRNLDWAPFSAGAIGVQRTAHRTKAHTFGRARHSCARRPLNSGNFDLGSVALLAGNQLSRWKPPDTTDVRPESEPRRRSKRCIRLLPMRLRL